MRGKKVNNWQALVEASSLWLASLAIFLMVVSGYYQNYVTHKSLPWLIFFVLITFALGVIAFKERTKAKEQKSVLHCLVLIIPLVLILLPHKNASSLSFSTINNSGESTLLSYSGEKLWFAKQDTPTFSGDQANPNQSNNYPADDPYGKARQPMTVEEFKQLKGIQDLPEDQKTGDFTPAPLTPSKQRAQNKQNERPKDNRIKVSDADYYVWVQELLQHPEIYDGVELTLKGFIFASAPNLEQGEIAIARLCMACCAADMFPFGLYAKNESSVELKDGAWITATGTLKMTEEQGQKRLVLQIKEVKPAEKTSPEYVIPVY